MSNIRRIGGCAKRENIIGILFNDVETEYIIPVRLRSCPKKLSKNCCLSHKEGGCHRYRIGTKGSTRISWDRKDKRM